MGCTDESIHGSENDLRRHFREDQHPWQNAGEKDWSLMHAILHHREKSGKINVLHALTFE
jgi:hypothetical protein